MKKGTGRTAKGEGGASECCMCGDYGLSSELFACKNCKFRSQHKYCSNLYPEAKSYSICNWCLTQKDAKTNGQGNAETNFPNSSSPSQGKSTSDRTKMSKMKRELGQVNHGDQEDIKKPTSKQIKRSNNFRADQPRPSSAGRKRVTTDGRVGITKRIITKRSREMSDGGMIVKQGFRNKVRRYKLLDEVSR